MDLSTKNQHNCTSISILGLIELIKKSNAKVAYKYLETREQCENFLKGNIWFTGIHRNRLLGNDTNEYRYFGHEKIFSPSLSLSLVPPTEVKGFLKKKPFCVEIHDLDGFIDKIIEALRNPQFQHLVSWLNKSVILKELEPKTLEEKDSKKKELLEAQRKNMLHLKNLEEIHIEKYNLLQLPVFSLCVRNIDYYDESTSTSVKPLSLEANNRAWNKREKYKDEQELRLELHTGSLMSNGKAELALNDLIEHIKLSCSDMSRFCKIISTQLQLGNRIKRARKSLGLTLRNLGDQLFLSHAAIKKYEDNQVLPSSEMLVKLAKALNVRVEYFFRPEQFTLQSIQYRKHHDISPKHLKQIEIKVLDKVEQRLNLENIFPSPPCNPFKLINPQHKIQNLNDVELLADQVRRDWNLGEEPISELIDLLEKQGLKIFEIDNKQYPNFDGLTAKVNDLYVIVIDNQWPGDRQRFTLLHELGHILLAGYLPQHLDEEQCCHRFAGAFLLPKSAVVSKLGSHRTNLELMELSLLKQEYGSSMLSILHRIKDAGIITDSLYNAMRNEFNAHGWTQHEPGKPFPQEKTHVFEQLVFHALAESYISESRAAEFMNLTIEAFRTRRMDCQNVASDK